MTPKSEGNQLGYFLWAIFEGVTLCLRYATVLVQFNTRCARKHQGASHSYSNSNGTLIPHPHLSSKVGARDSVSYANSDEKN